MTLGYASDVFPNRKDEVLSVPESPRSVSSMPSLEESRPKRAQSLVIYPYRIRPNAYFKGRQQDLVNLHRNLRGKGRRQNGTSAVLLQSLPGGGKSHLARQYVYLHGHEYRGGIYWIPSWSEQEMEESFWNIARTRTMQGFETEPWKRNLLDPRKMIETVRNWFESFDDWLIVFDGIHFDPPREANFIPSVKNTSIIYTSTNRAAHGNHEFNNPILHKLGRLSQKDAQELLLEEIGKAAPFSTNDLAQAGQAVDLMGRLPLMIHVTAQYLNETREPLVKYIHLFKDRRKAGTLDAYKIVREELERRGEIEALNLIYILSFFAQNTPVEMLVLGTSPSTLVFVSITMIDLLTDNTGLHALDSRTPVRARDTANRRSLNNTLTVLIRWAMIERNESDDSSSTSSFSSPPSSGSLPEPSDTLRVHSIIQDFFVDTLIECKEAAFWLERAVSVFCHSYDSADLRIRQDPKIGLPEDYRRYSIHGKQLLRRVEQLTKKHPRLGRLQPPLQKRLDGIRIGIDELTESLNRAIMQGRPDLVPTSIFDVANSFSDSDSAQTSQEPTPSYDEMKSIDFIPHMAPEIVDSPTLFVTPDVNATQKTPYPAGDEFPMIKYPEDIEIDSESGTPQPRSSSNSVAGFPPDLSRHRTVKRQEERRYHDHAGSMRHVSADDTDARVNPKQKDPDSSYLSQFLGMVGSPSRQKSTPSSGTASPRRSFLEKFFKSPFTSETSLATTQVEDTVTPPSVVSGSTKGKGPSASTGASLLTRDSSYDSVAFQERLSRSDMGPGAVSPPMWDDEPNRGISVRPPGHGAAHINDEDLGFSFPPDQPFTSRLSVDMPSWPESAQPSGYTSQPMSRQTSDNPATRTQGSTPRATPSRRRRPSHIETEPSPTLGLGGSGPFRSWDERHARSRDEHGAGYLGSRRRGRTLGTEVMGRRPGIEDSPRAAGIVTGNGDFYAFWNGGAQGGTGDAGDMRERRGSRAREEDLAGIGLGITGGS